MRLVDLTVQTTIRMVVPDVIDNELFEGLDESIVQGLAIQEDCVWDEFKFENIYDSFIKDMEVIEDSETYAERMKQQEDDWNRSMEYWEEAKADKADKEHRERRDKWKKEPSRLEKAAVPSPSLSVDADEDFSV